MHIQSHFLHLYTLVMAIDDNTYVIARYNWDDGSTPKREAIITGSTGYNKYRDMNNNKLARHIRIKCNVHNLVAIRQLILFFLVREVAVLYI